MLIKKSADLRFSDITPKPAYFDRRKFLAGIPAALFASKEMLSPSARALALTKLPNLVKSPLSAADEKVNTYQDVTHYNNFYEFGTQKNQPAILAQKLKTSPWTVSIEGEVEKPLKLSMDDIMKVAPIEERIYRHRCVETWSIVVPWAGYSLSKLLQKANPTSKARYAVFESRYDQTAMWSSEKAGIQFPYVEGLRLDEAMHPLALLCVGMYGETLPPQDGAPVRIVLPWKYGFKSIKSIVRIKLATKQPPTTWNLANAPWYGFYSNVNPHVDRQRWSQATEERLGEGTKRLGIVVPVRRPTLMFNGYGDRVASLYAGMDLKKYY